MHNATTEAELAPSPAFAQEAPAHMQPGTAIVSVRLTTTAASEATLRLDLTSGPA
jgi:hypothetical protein